MSNAVKRGARWRRKCWFWCRRYLPAELVGTACAFIGSSAIYGLLTDRAWAAIAGTVSENVGFYGILAVTEWHRQCVNGHGSVHALMVTARLLLAEFGLIELLDSTALRPLFMYLGPWLTGGIGSGTLLGKLMADAVFYAGAIVSYEFVRRRTSVGTPASVAPANQAGRRPE